MSRSPGTAGDVSTVRPRTMRVLAGAAIVLVVGAGCSVRPTTDRSNVVDCSEFAAFLDQPAMPVGITDATCTYEAWLDEHLTAEFHLADLSALDDWLARLPASEPLSKDSHDDVVEYDQLTFRPRLEGGADDLEVSAVQLADGFHVTMSAFNV